jgi:hypothetical protein
MNKEIFLKEQLVPAIASIAPDFSPLWGKMNVQQMTEHLSREGFQFASGKSAHSLVTPEEQIPQMHAFLRSDKEFRENTPNKLMASEPVVLKHSSMDKALKELQEEIDYFFKSYENQPERKIMNPFFGELDFELQIQLLHKHARHHLKQFGITI